MRHDPPQRGSGFTLVELISAITITVLVTGAAATLLRTTSHARARVDQQVSTQGDARAAINTIATAVRNAHRAVTHKDQIIRGVDDWHGNAPADRLALFTVSGKTIRRGQPESDVHEIEFFLTQIEGEPLPALMRRTDPTRNARPDEGGVIERVARRVIALSFEFHNGLTWQDQWPAKKNTWPAAVRIRLIVAGDDEARRVTAVSRLVNFPHRETPKPGGEQ